MTDTFVILAAGRGSRIGRVGENLHKALVPLGGKAILSRLIDLAPEGADIVVAVGHQSQQIRDYLSLAHPRQPIYTLEVEDWDAEGIGGPGHSLLATEQVVVENGGDLIFTSCDTLWEPDHMLWQATSSWAAVAPIPVGTAPDRWCRFATDPSGRPTEILDKIDTYALRAFAYTGLAMIKQADLDDFFEGIVKGSTRENERQVTGGLDWLLRDQRLGVQRIRWTDVGDAEAYHRAVIECEGYDWTKEAEATWVLPETGRVVKWWAKDGVAQQMVTRAGFVRHGLPKVVGCTRQMMAYEYAQGELAYDTVGTEAAVDRLIGWARSSLWLPAENVDTATMHDACREFYYTKTIERLNMLPGRLRDLTFDVIARIDWSAVIDGCEPVRWHGDLNFGNIVSPDGYNFTAIDWRSDFAGQLWGDRRYDVAKLLVGCRLHWSRIRKGDFSPWPEGQILEDTIRARLHPGRDVDMIAALTLVNSAPLHAAPLDDVLVTHAIHWMERL